MAENYEIYDLFVSQEEFAVTSPNSSNRRIRFKPDGKFEDPEFSTWELISELGTPRLILSQSGNVLCKLYWHSQKWEGRDVRKGVTTIRPLKNPHEWSKIMEKKPADAAKRPELLMRERVTGKMAFEAHAYNISSMFEKKKDAAIAIIGCNRRDYFSRTLGALRKNKTLSEYDCFAFLDRPLASHESRIRDEIASDLDGFNVVKHRMNLGCGRTLIDAREQLFQNMGYDRVFIFEDDMVPSDNYLQFCENLLKWGQKNYTNIGAVQGWSKCLLPKDQKIPLQRQVYATYTNWWGYLMPKSTWDSIRGFVLEYQNLFLNVEYSRRPHRTIMEWFKPKAQSNFKTFQGGFIPDANSIEHRRILHASIPSGQDGATWIGFDDAGFVRLAPTVNRGLYLGERGIHMRPEQFRRDRFDQVTLDQFEDDGKIKKFEPR
jgi:hypothetical protein